MRTTPIIHFLATFGLAALSPGCSLVTEAGDYEVESEESKPDAGKSPSTPGTSGRNLDFTLINFSPHAGIAVDIAVVSRGDVLQARAIVLMPPAGSGEYAPERIELEGVLLPGENKLFFFADNDRSMDLQAFTIEGEKKVRLEHSWILEVPQDGVLKFPHATNFEEFRPGDYSQQRDVVFRLPEIAAGATAEVQRNIRDRFDSALGNVAEIAVFSDDDGRQVGLFRRHAGIPFPEGELRLPGIADPGTLYAIELAIDGKVVMEFSQRAPIDGNMTILATKWLPDAAVGLFPGAR